MTEGQKEASLFNPCNWCRTIKSNCKYYHNTEIKPVSTVEIQQESGWKISDSAAVRIDEDGIIQEIRPDSYLFPKTIENVIKSYIGDEVERFCRENHITKRAWKKHGVIEADMHLPELLIYNLVYEHFSKRRYQKIKINSNVIKINI